MMQVYKGVLVILDGLGDRPHVQLDGKTPLQAARTPNMDQLVERGMSGLVHPYLPGVPVGTQTGSSLLMGMTRSDVPKLARGPVEAAGVGCLLQPGDVAVRCNFATLEQNGPGFTILDRRAGRQTFGLPVLAQALEEITLDPSVHLAFKSATGHRAVLYLSGDHLSAHVTDTDPGAGRRKDGVQVCRPLNEGGAYTAQLINRFQEQSFLLLDQHPINQQRREQGLKPANGVLLRGAGQVVSLKNIVTELGLSATVVTGERTLVGLGRLFGFEVIQKPQFTATLETDLEGKVLATLDALKDHDLVFLHIKATDTAAHDRTPLTKMMFIEQIDVALKPLVDHDLVLGVTSDHSTDSTTGRHTGDPVPAVLAARHGRSDLVDTFSEVMCMSGGLGSMSPTAYLASMLDLMNQTRNLSKNGPFFIDV